MAEPLPICYLNGEFLPFEAARISPFDRGFLFGDGAYEVMPVYDGRPFRAAAHCERLTRSLAAIRMEDPHTCVEWRALFAALLEKNGGGDQALYWQVTRGAERGRNHAPLPKLTRTVFLFSAPLVLPGEAARARGVACISARDTRWARCDIKSTALLANVLLRELAVDANAAETILLRDGHLTEGSSSAVHVVREGELRTPEHSSEILPGTTRSVVEELAARTGIVHRARPVSEAELRGADEIWLSSAAREIVPVTTLDGAAVGSGLPGPVWRRVYDELQQYKRELAGQPW
ncbi:MAG TPA: aminotransferase class IV [Steroidobacteraceae bacterium]|nr:aminotransferase class IV [Steroidobacteraceae bacterium]